MLNDSIFEEDRVWIDHDSTIEPVANYPQLEFSMKAVQRAGKALTGNIEWDWQRRMGVLETFQVANSWRDSHLLPMRGVRISVISRMRKIGVGGFTAARPKRMPSIRRKLRRTSIKLDQINDLAGCRAVVDDIDGVNRLINECRDHLPHSLRQEYHYISRPKSDGYRCHHMVFEYVGKGAKSAFNRRRVELQIRTRLQHSWATAVEAVGLFRSEDLKAGFGSSDWLRLFEIMSAEFAYSENCDVPIGLVNRSNRVEEIRHLDNSLRATSVLQDIHSATKYVQDFSYEQAPYFLITYDPSNHEVKVTPYSEVSDSARRFGEAERRIAESNSDKKVVMVEKQKVAKLIDAFPNYFGDVSLFIRNLSAVCLGEDAIEYTMAPQSIVKPKVEKNYDPSWLKRRYRRWKW